MMFSRQEKILAAKSVAVLSVIPVLIYAYAGGPDPRHTGAPGDQTCARSGCHAGTLNPPGGSVTISASGGTSYVPGQRQRITVTINDAAQQVFGFQATARLESNLTGGQAGTFTPIDNRTAVLCDDGRVRPAAGCGAQFPVEFIQHTGVNLAQNTFSFDWTPPATNVGNVRLYVAGNAANGNNTASGDRIYTTSLTLTPAAAGGPRPTIAQGGVTDAFNFVGGIASNTWTAIFGENLASVTKTWDDAVQGTRLPTTLEGVSVSVNNRPATIFFVSPGQINILTPNDDATGDVAIVVRNANGESTPFTVRKTAVKPAFYAPFGSEGRLFVTAVALDGTLVGKVGTDSRVRRAARPGEVILVFGTGFGPTNPVVPTDQVVSGAPAVTTPVRIRFGETVASFAGTGNLVAAGLYQFNVTVPATLANGDYPLIAEVAGISSASNVFISVQR
ncbi:MAG: hypothetical protein NZV14_07265 [Bryobacteraceae bacterium]|nr:hypothetical protein [Bryobacteraceae bacterium]MDW8377943.1 choice-of-anchor V domain-containing protein [Bryobacterales bacterium]